VASIVVGPYAKRNHVSHCDYDQTSILAFMERKWKWNLHAMIYRDANAKRGRGGLRTSRGDRRRG